ncbi:AcrB/AcrD/AcrF family protein [Endozoicomonas sp. OPT23]|uniref:efflux RND transporter permease subunit n=1 Tax=Endozoicomonas sp. OPT23 TaxID=2072845 RepID=UPI00129B8CDC|nr:efflux RND transporter permease subunit [Endozoicomonas sp. OPT23]MRI32009.1 AcrB/AcrD/AcrF family protein [Endozoicomonas sp. OPT23]
MNGLKNKLFLQNLLARLLLGLFLLMGTMAYNTMVRENHPDLEIPRALITTSWPGASPEQIEKELTKPLEDEIRNLVGMNIFTSGSYNSYSMIGVEFDADISMTLAMQQLRAKVSAAESEFSSSAIKKPEIEQLGMSEAPVISLVLHGDVDDLILTDVAKNIEQQLEEISDVKKVNLGGLREKSLHIRLQPNKLRALGISPLTVRDRLSSANMDMAWGQFEGEESTFNLYLDGRFDSVERVRQLPIVRMGDNRPVRLGEIADVSLRLDKEKMRTLFSMKGSEYTRGVTVDVLKRPGADTIALINKTEQKAMEISSQPDWPRALKLTVVTDDRNLIEQSFSEIYSSMIQATLLVFIILMVLLSWREALIAGLALPVTLLATLAVLGAMGHTFNATVMVGMVLALGMLVDVYILVMEGMHEGLFVRRERFNQAVMSTVKTFALPAFAGQMTTILAMIPMMMMGGIDGKFIRIIPITITVALILSLIIAFLICLPLSRYLLAKAADGGRELLVDKLTHRYRQGLADWLLSSPLKSKKHATGYVLAAFAMFILSISLVGKLPSALYVESDDRKLGISIELPPQATLESAQIVADKVGIYLNSQSWIEKSIAYVGAKTPVASSTLKTLILPSEAWNQVGFTVILVPRSEREKFSFDYLSELRAGIDETIKDEAGLRVSITHKGNKPSGEDPVQIELNGPEYSELMIIAAEIRQLLAEQPGAVGVKDNLGASLREIRFRFKPEQLNFYGLDESNVAQQIRISMEEDQFGSFKMAGIQDDPDIRISMQWPSRGDEMGGPLHITEIRLLRVITKDGRSIPLSHVADLKVVEKPRVFIHNYGLRSVTVQSRAEGKTAAAILAGIKPELDKLQSGWPEGYSYQFGGDSSRSDESFGTLGVAFVLAVVLIFILLTLMFNSMLQPLIILFIIPLAITGTFIGYFYFGVIVTFGAMVGCVSLAGIAVNNGIVLLETMNNHRRQGRSIRESAAYGAADRMRPILSTSLTTILGLLPLALSEPRWYGLCMAIVFGLIASTIVAMFIIPALYLLFTRDKADEDECLPDGAGLNGAVNGA